MKYIQDGDNPIKEYRLSKGMKYAVEYGEKFGWFEPLGKWPFDDEIIEEMAKECLEKGKTAKELGFMERREGSIE